MTQANDQVGRSEPSRGPTGLDFIGLMEKLGRSGHYASRLPLRPTIGLPTCEIHPLALLKSLNATLVSMVVIDLEVTPSPRQVNQRARHAK